jgi:hypothetical protein
MRIGHHIKALKAEALIQASNYLNRRAERLVADLAETEHYITEMCEESWRSIYKQRWPEEFKKATEEEPAF